MLLYIYNIFIYICIYLKKKGRHSHFARNFVCGKQSVWRIPARVGCARIYVCLGNFRAKRPQRGLRSPRCFTNPTPKTLNPKALSLILKP